MSPTTRKHWHLGIAVFFVIQIPLALLTDLKESLPYLVFLSQWALVGTHLAGASAELPSEGE